MATTSFLSKVVRRIVRSYLTIKNFEFWQKWGFHVMPVNFYSPVPDTAEIPEDVWENVVDLKGRIDLREEYQIQLLDTFSSNYKSEYDSFPVKPTNNPIEFYTSVRSFNCVDAQVLYSIIRHFKPRKMIEIGSGFSTILSNQAIQKNKDEDSSYVCDFAAVEPYPDYILGEGARLEMLPNLSRLIVKKVQEVPLQAFMELQENDILFIDSSHTVRIGGDTLFEVFKILPILNKGVIVHVHDIFLPYEYPRKWTHEQKWFWTEQYLIDAFLSYNNHFEIMWLSHFMHRNYSALLTTAMKAYDPNERYMGSLWIRKVK